LGNSVAESSRYCRKLARRTGRNFYFSFLTLPRDLFRDMCVLYAFMRHTDDLGDREDISTDERATLLHHWRQRLNRAVEGESVDDPILPALADMIRRRGVPAEYLHEVVSGVESDLTPRRFESFADLEGYCYQVAGAVGLCCIHIWGFDNPRASALAIECGLAFQLTNILRDLGEDAAAGRIYLPREDLDHFGYSPADIEAGVIDERFRGLMRFQVARARSHYEVAAELCDYLGRRGRRAFSAMFRIYRALLEEIERRGFDVYSRRVRLSAPRKLTIALSSLCGFRLTQHR
jgi:phytoene synthase